MSSSADNNSELVIPYHVLTLERPVTIMVHRSFVPATQWRRVYVTDALLFVGCEVQINIRGTDGYRHGELTAIAFITIDFTVFRMREDHTTRSIFIALPHAPPIMTRFYEFTGDRLIALYR
jgi:hypothetical protein